MGKPTVEALDPALLPGWDDFVRASPRSSVYHLSAWSRVLAETFGYLPLCLAVREGGEIRSALPFMVIRSWLTGSRLISLPRTPHCDPLAGEGRDLGEILGRAVSLLCSEGLGFAEVRVRDGSGFPGEGGWKGYHLFDNQVLPLAGTPDSIFGSFHRTCVRQRIARAERGGIVVREGGGEEDLESFYRLYLLTTRAHNIPPRPLRFFRNILGHFPRGQSWMLLAEKDGKAGAAGIFLHHRDTVTFEFNVMDDRQAESSPGHMVIWEAIRRAHARGCRQFDFGMTPVDNPGLREFKARWGTESRPLTYFFYPDLAGYKRAAMGASREPGSLRERLKTRIAGALYRHFG